MAPHCMHLRNGTKMGNAQMIDTMITRRAAGMPSTAITWATPPRTWRSSARSPASSRTSSPLASQNKAEAAQKAGRFKDEIVPVTVKDRKGDVMVDTDEYPEARHHARYAWPSCARPSSRSGTVTAGNASGLNDGAAAVVLMSGGRWRPSAASRRSRASSPGRPPASIRRSWAPARSRPSRAALQKAGWKVDDLDLIEANEAFAAQACAVNKDMGWDPAKVNVNGGAIAIGHPIGASGARVLVTLLHEMQKRDAKKGLATLCIGGGMGIALTVER